MIAAHERQDVATADVVEAYLHAYIKDIVLLKITGQTVDILCKVSKEYQSFVCIEHGKPVIYLRLVKALYGCVKSALL
jgi:hypothetical protein